MKKTVIIINGRGGVGKDTLCDMAAKHYRAATISSITPVKNIAAACGWDGRKDDRSRRFLSDLKKLLSDYNDYPTRYLLEEYHRFLEGDGELLFVHIREGEEIAKFRRQLTTPSLTLLVRRSSQSDVRWGNRSDDEVEDYQYDFTFDNDRSLEETEPVFLAFLEHAVQQVQEGRTDGAAV